MRGWQEGPENLGCSTQRRDQGTESPWIDISPSHSPPLNLDSHIRLGWSRVTRKVGPRFGAAHLGPLGLADNNTVKAITHTSACVLLEEALATGQRLPSICCVNDWRVNGMTVTGFGTRSPFSQ